MRPIMVSTLVDPLDPFDAEETGVRVFSVLGSVPDSFILILFLIGRVVFDTGLGEPITTVFIALAHLENMTDGSSGQSRSRRGGRALLLYQYPIRRYLVHRLRSAVDLPGVVERGFFIEMRASRLTRWDCLPILLV